MNPHPFDRLPDPLRPSEGPSRRLLQELLDLAGRAGPEYGGGLANHLPMALHALHELGAGEARLREFLAASLPRLEVRADLPMPAPLKGPWQDLRGDRASHVALEAHFNRSLAQDDQDQVLRRVLPELLPGVSAAAFHGLIRVAHAAEAAHRGELAGALAYWASRWTPLPRGGGGGALSFVAWRDTLLAAQTLPRPPGRLIAERIRHVVHTPACDALLGRLPGSTEVLAGLAALAVARYAAGGDFTVLHLVTATRAMRVLLPWIDEPGPAVGHLADAFAAAWLSCGVDAPAAPPARLGWDEVVHRAVASDDEHVIKLVHACRSQAGLGVAAPWLEAAERAVS